MKKETKKANSSAKPAVKKAASKAAKAPAKKSAPVKAEKKATAKKCSCSKGGKKCSCEKDGKKCSCKSGGKKSGEKCSCGKYRRISSPIKKNPCKCGGSFCVIFCHGDGPFWQIWLLVPVPFFKLPKRTVPVANFRMTVQNSLTLRQNKNILCVS